MNKILNISHVNCLDGMAASWVLHRFFGDDNLETVFLDYGNPMPDVTGRDVIFTDFSVSHEELLKLGASANSVIVLDHHKTAEKELTGFDQPLLGKFYYTPNSAVVKRISKRPLCLFDKERSGAGIAWDFFFPDEQRAPIIDHVEDNDLHKFSIPHTKEIVAALASYNYDFILWDSLSRMDPMKFVIEGKAISRKTTQDIFRITQNSVRRITLGGYTISIINVPRCFVSETAHLLAECDYNGIGACYYDTSTGRRFSLRSSKGIDVSVLAERYGGGGHASAASFEISDYNWFGDKTWFQKLEASYRAILALF